MHELVLDPVLKLRCHISHCVSLKQLNVGSQHLAFQNSLPCSIVLLLSEVIGMAATSAKLVRSVEAFQSSPHHKSHTDIDRHRDNKNYV